MLQNVSWSISWSFLEHYYNSGKIENNNQSYYQLQLWKCQNSKIGLLSHVGVLEMDQYKRDSSWKAKLGVSDYEMPKSTWFVSHCIYFFGIFESYTGWVNFESCMSSLLYNLWADSLQGNGKERKREEKPVCTALNSELSSCEALQHLH